MLGHEVLLPETPHLLAMLSGAPLIVFFSRRTGKKRYHLKMSEPLYVEKAPRQLRAEAIHKSAQGYADLLETHLRGNLFPSSMLKRRSYGTQRDQNCHHQNLRGKI